MSSFLLQKTEEVKQWWENNPFAFGVSNKKGDQVGTIPIGKMNLNYFEEIEKRFRKHSRGGGQEDRAPLLSKLIDYDWINGKKGLDIATGSGFSLVSFVKGGAEMVGIDLTPFAVEHSKKNLEIRGLKAKVLQMDAQQLGFHESSFDFVNAWGCLMHMPHTEKAISEIYRVLRPRGKILAYMYNKSSWPFWFNIIFLRGVLLLGLIRFHGDVTKLTSRYSDGYSRGGNPMTKFYSPTEARKMFLKAGFRNVQASPWGLPDEPDHWPLRSFPIFKYFPNKIKSFMSKRWGYGLIVKAEK